MRPTPSTLKLPANLIHELGGYDLLARSTNLQDTPTSRSSKRKSDRVQKKVERGGRYPLKRQKIKHPEPRDASWFKPNAREGHSDILLHEQACLEGEPRTNSIKSSASLLSELGRDDIHSLQSPHLPVKVSRRVVARLAQDDAEIAALEKKLGIKSSRHLPRAFKDDGLDELLESVDGELGTAFQVYDTNQAGKIWLEQKRSQATTSRYGANGSGKEKILRSKDDINPGIHSTGPVYEEGGLAKSLEGNTVIDLEHEINGFDSELEKILPQPPPPREKENHYAPPSSDGGQVHLKYIPPSLRNPSSDDEALERLRRQAQGLINRLTEANLISILSDVERLYRENARKYVTSTLVNLLLASVCEPTTLPDTLIILPAGFMTALYKVVGTDFGAEVIERVVNLFDEHYNRTSETDNSIRAISASRYSKETSNLITLLAELYNFQLVGCNLIFDYIRFFLRTLSELNAELLLRIIRACGTRLRQDDPSSLRDIINMLAPAVENIGEHNLSVRTKFMIESINDLKNNRLRTGISASSINSEHIVQMKKTLGTLNTRNLKANEPLRIGLKDIHESDKKGKWWLIGASWVGNASAEKPNQTPNSMLRKIDKKLDVVAERGGSDLVRLAQEQRMNTDIRKAIFITIMSSLDYQDAYRRLMKLKLKKVQELEIPKVLIRCASAEEAYNPYYTLIAQKLCGDKKLRIAFQFSLWDLFKRLGESGDNAEASEECDDDEILDTRRIVNYAKMYGVLIVEGGISLTVLKHLKFRYLQPKTKMFLEVLLVTVLLRIQAQSSFDRDESAVRAVFSKLVEIPSTAKGLQYFLRKVVAKTDIAGGEAATATLIWACKVAVSTLHGLLTAAP